MNLAHRLCVPHSDVIVIDGIYLEIIVFQGLCIPSFNLHNNFLKQVFFLSTQMYVYIYIHTSIQYAHVHIYEETKAGKGSIVNCWLVMLVGKLETQSISKL
jgi:hypothetical protein